MLTASPCRITTGQATNQAMAALAPDAHVLPAHLPARQHMKMSRLYFAVQHRAYNTTCLKFALDKFLTKILPHDEEVWPAFAINLGLGAGLTRDYFGPSPCRAEGVQRIEHGKRNSAAYLCRNAGGTIKRDRAWGGRHASLFQAEKNKTCSTWRWARWRFQAVNGSQHNGDLTLANLAEPNRSRAAVCRKAHGSI